MTSCNGEQVPVWMGYIFFIIALHLLNPSQILRADCGVRLILWDKQCPSAMMIFIMLKILGR